MTEAWLVERTAHLEARRRVRLWYDIVGAPVVWALQAALLWFVESRACADGTRAWGPLGAGGVNAVFGVVTALAFAAAAYAFAGSWRAWQATDAAPQLTAVDGHGVHEYLAVAGVLISGVFLLAILWTGLPIVLVSACETWR